MKPGTIKVLITDDHELVRMGLAALFNAQDDIMTIGEAVDGAEAVRLVPELRPDVVVMDIMMPAMDGIAATERICRESPRTKILCLTTSTSPEEHRHALEAGAAGILTKGDDSTMLLEAIRTVAAGGTFVSPESKALIDRSRLPTPLTDRQHEILTFVARGMRTKEIASHLGISAESVRDHIDAIYKKVGASNRAEAVSIALKRQLLKM